jgi:hypothetical protein
MSGPVSFENRILIIRARHKFFLMLPGLNKQFIMAHNGILDMGQSAEANAIGAFINLLAREKKDWTKISLYELRETYRTFCENSNEGENVQMKNKEESKPCLDIFSQYSPKNAALKDR